MSSGYIFGMSNSSISDIFHIAVTDTPRWRPTEPYVIEFAKKVSNPEQKKQALDIAFRQCEESARGLTLETVKFLFDLMDGEVIDIDDDDAKN
jgi:hypothetical protein